MYPDTDWQLVDRPTVTENDTWDMVSHEEAVGYFTDRILLILGPNKVNYQIPIARIRNSSVLLVTTAGLPPSDRHIRLPSLDISMVDMYIAMDSTAPFALEHSWGDVIKLAITAEVLQDGIVEQHAITALKKKEKLVQEGISKDLATDEYGIAWKYCRTTGHGEWLLKVLNSIRERSDGRSRIMRPSQAQTPPSPLPPPLPAATAPKVSVQVPSTTRAVALPQAFEANPKRDSITDSHQDNAPKFHQPPQGVAFVKYPNSVLRGEHMTTVNKEEEGQWNATRQPSVPPSVEGLQTGAVGNFVWPVPDA